MSILDMLYHVPKIFYTLDIVFSGMRLYNTVRLSNGKAGAATPASIMTRTAWPPADQEHLCRLKLSQLRLIVKAVS